jgi:putative membrane protein
MVEWQLAAGLCAGSASVGYLAVAIGPPRRGGRWPAYRSMLWCAGLGTATVALVGPLADAAERDFTAHVAGHLLLGMLAPLLLVSAAPVTLALRTLPLTGARRLARILDGRTVQVLTHPITATALNVGGLWLLYTTDLYPRSIGQEWLHLAVHAHVLASGYLFASAVVGVDPAPHRPGRPQRAVVLLLYLTAHTVLARYLYAHPPTGVPAEQSQRAAVLMYYGGDAIDLGLIVVFCQQWFTARRPDPIRRGRAYRLTRRGGARSRPHHGVPAPVPGRSCTAERSPDRPAGIHDHPFPACGP